LTKWSKILAALFLLCCAGRAHAEQDSFCLPTTGTVSGLTFAQAANDALRSLATSHSGPSAPSNDCSEAPVLGQVWLDTSATPNVWRIYDGSSTWVPIGSVDASGHRWVPPVGGGASSVASASTTSLWSVPEAAVTISGNTSITSFGTGTVTGTIKFVTFSGSPTLVYNATSMILPGAASIAAAPGDRGIVMSLGDGNAAVVSYSRASGQPLVANSSFTSAILYSSVISPTALAASTNDWSPTGLAAANTIRLSLTGSQTLTGIASQAAGTELMLFNIDSSDTLTLASDSSASSASNRFSFGADLLLGPGAAVSLRYDGTTSRWLLAGLARNQATQAQALAGTDNTTTMTPLRVEQRVDAERASIEAYVEEGSRFLSRQIFTSSGSWTRPTGARLIRVRGCGGGGGGGGADTGDGDASAAGSGGGAGECGEFPLDVEAISSLSITVGTAGTAGSSGGGDAGAGGNTTVGAHATFDGGSAGGGADASSYGAATGANGGTDGAVPSGGLLVPGGDGSSGSAVAGRTGDQNMAAGGAGGVSMFGGGGRGGIRINDGGSSGGAGNAYGSGGGGAASVNGSGAAGGAGRGGIVIIDSYI